MIYPTNPSKYDDSVCSEYDLLEGIYFYSQHESWIFVESEGMRDDISAKIRILITNEKSEISSVLMYISIIIFGLFHYYRY